MRGRSYRLNAWLYGGALFCLASRAAACLAAETAPAGAFSLPGNASLLSAIVKVFGSLLVVVGIMLVVLYCIKKAGLGSGRSRSGSVVAVLETRMVAPRKYIAVVEIADRCLALGITDHNINLLADLGPEVKAALAKQSAVVASGSAFASLLQKSMTRWQAGPPDSGAQAKDGNQARQESA